MKTKRPVVALIAMHGYDLGVRHISAFLRSKGCTPVILFFETKKYLQQWELSDYFTTQVLDENAHFEENVELLVSFLKDLRPDIVGISLTSVTFEPARHITSRIKKDVGSFIVWGGVHALLCPEECIEWADAVCVGEGEHAVWELIQQWSESGSITGIENLWIKTGEKIEKNPGRTLIEDLDQLPYPDFLGKGNKFLIEGGRLIADPVITSVMKKNVYSITTSRGCIFDCSFCCNAALKARYAGAGRYYRRRSVGNVIAELSYAISRGSFSMIQFWDEVFTIDDAWLAEFCVQYREKIRKPFVCYVHPNNAHQDIMEKLIDAGLAIVDMGIQSGSERVNTHYFNRPQNNRGLMAFSKYAHEKGVLIFYDVLVDIPYETRESFEETMDLLLSLPRPFRARIYSLCYFPKTRLTEKALASGIMTKEALKRHVSNVLNNFHLSLPAARDPSALFKDCVIAMACNPRFSGEIVEYARKNRFFEEHPRFLFLISLFSMRAIRFFKGAATVLSLIFGPSGAKNRGFIQRCEPRYSLREGRFDRRSKNERPLVEILLYPDTCFKKEGQGLRVKIKNNAGKKANVRLFFDLYEAQSRSRGYVRWKTRVDGVSGQFEGLIRFAYPDFWLNEEYVPVSCRKGDIAFTKGRAYMMSAWMHNPFCGVKQVIADRVFVGYDQEDKGTMV